VDDTIIGYRVGLPYTGPEIDSPFGSSVGLLFEGGPIYKIWLEDPTPTEIAILRGICTHIGFSTTRPNITPMPFFLFRDGEGKGFKVQAPMCSLPQEVQRWAAGDSNIFSFVLIDSNSRIVKSLGVLGVPSDFRKRLIDLWSSRNHLHALDADNRKEMLEVVSEGPNLNPSTTWAFDPVEEEFKLMSGEVFASSILEAARAKARNIEILVGELIEFLAYDAKLGVKRHDTGKVIAFDARRNIKVLLNKDSRIVQFNLKDYPYIDYAYAPAGVPAKLQSPGNLFMSEDNKAEPRVILIREVLEPYGYVPIERPAKGSSASTRS
jgi:hypothetical protein